jgi:2-phosphoglycolate phosphatase
MSIAGVLFDLDGTLLDTAPDMGGALNELLVEHGAQPLPAALIRPWVSNGAAALVRLGFGAVDPVRHEHLRLRFLELYARRLAYETRLFPGGDALLTALESAGVPWGIVTNKPGWLTDPLLESLGLAARAGVVISGDTLPEKKPHPAPLWLAAERLAVAPAAIAYLGDAERDMVAARAAGMRAVAATWGYIDPVAGHGGWPFDDEVHALDGVWPWLERNGLRS